MSSSSSSSQPSSQADYNNDDDDDLISKKDHAWQLLKGLRLEHVKTPSLEDDGIELNKSSVHDAQQLEILFSLPTTKTKTTKDYCHDNDENEKRKQYYWNVQWIELLPGTYQTLLGYVHCEPFFDDPPIHNLTALDDDDKSYMNQVDKSRRGWQLQRNKSFHNECCLIRKGANLTSNQISIEQITRCLIPAVGILAKYHPSYNNNNSNNNNNWVLQRLMLRLEREVRCTWNNSDNNNNNNNGRCKIEKKKEDPNVWETSDNLYHRGGILSHPVIIKKLKREYRWDSRYDEDDDADQLLELKLKEHLSKERGIKFATYDGDKIIASPMFGDDNFRENSKSSIRTCMSTITAIAAAKGMSLEETREMADKYLR